jgi:hypothetical protein
MITGIAQPSDILVSDNNEIARFTTEVIFTLRSSKPIDSNVDFNLAGNPHLIDRQRRPLRLF